MPASQKYLFRWASRNWLDLNRAARVTGRQPPTSLWSHLQAKWHTLTAMTANNCHSQDCKNHKRRKRLNSWNISTHSKTQTFPPLLAISPPHFSSSRPSPPTKGWKVVLQFFSHFFKNKNLLHCSIGAWSPVWGQNLVTKPLRDPLHSQKHCWGLLASGRVPHLATLPVTLPSPASVYPDTSCALLTKFFPSIRPWPSCATEAAVDFSMIFNKPVIGPVAFNY